MNSRKINTLLCATTKDDGESCRWSRSLTRIWARHFTCSPCDSCHLDGWTSPPPPLRWPPHSYQLDSGTRGWSKVRVGRGLFEICPKRNNNVIIYLYVHNLLYIFLYNCNDL